jgi:hypothetical protein
MRKPRRVPFSLTNLRRAVVVAREFNLVLAVDQSGEFRFLTGRGDPAADPLVVLDGRSDPSRYPHRLQQKPDDTLAVAEQV